jgi:hypothetical protein
VKLPKTSRCSRSARLGRDVTIHSSAVIQLSMSTRVSADSHSSAHHPDSVKPDRRASELSSKFRSADSHFACGGSSTSSRAPARFFTACRLWVTTRLGRRRRLRAETFHNTRLLGPDADRMRFFTRTLWFPHANAPCRNRRPRDHPLRGAIWPTAARCLRSATHHVAPLRNQSTFHLGVLQSLGSVSRHIRSGLATSTYASDTFFTRCAAR